MGSVYIIPQWFFSYDIILNLIFGVITLLVSLYAFKVYKLSYQIKSKIFGFSFFLISIAYFIRAIFIFILLSKLSASKALSLTSFTFWFESSLYLHIFFFLLGLITLVYMTIGSKGFKLYSLLSLLTFSPFIFAQDTLHLFNLLSALLLVYIFYYYLTTYLNVRNLRQFFIMLAFGLIFLSSIGFMLSVRYSLSFVVGDLLNLIAYVIIMINLIVIRKK